MHLNDPQVEFIRLVLPSGYEETFRPVLHTQFINDRQSRILHQLLADVEPWSYNTTLVMQGLEKALRIKLGIAA